MWTSRSCKFGFVITILGVLTHAPWAMAGSHSYINMMRSSTQSNLFVAQGLEVDYGDYTRRSLELDPNDNPAGVDGEKTSKWKGYGFKTSLGLEMMKFIILEAGHTFVNMQDGYNRNENLSGSRLHAGGRFVFSSPAGNLEAGAGITGGRYDYQFGLLNSNYYGSGMYYSLGMNYFFSTRISFFGYGKMNQENLVRNGGQSLFKNIKTETTGLGFGFNFWI